LARRRLLVDITPLRRSADFRWLFGGQLVSIIGSQLTVVAVPFQVFELTHSSLDVGLVSLAQLGPLVLFSLIGGAVADAYDRRKLLVIVQTLAAGTGVGLAINAASGHPKLWPLFVFSALIAGESGFVQPAYNAALPNLVEEELLPSAYALGQVLFQVGVVVGPAAAGALLASSGAQTVYWIDAASYLVCAAGALKIRPLAPAGGGQRASIRSIGEGFGYLKGRQAIQGIYLIDLNAMIFGMPRALFPALGTTVFHGGAQAVGYLYAAPGVGALIGAVTTGWVAHVRRQGRAVIVAVIVWGAAITAFGTTHWLPLALGLLAVAGWADVISAVFRNTILQMAVPDRLRGRLSSLQMAVVAGGPRVGDVEAGGMASAVDVRFSVISGGAVCIVGAFVVAAFLPGFRRQRKLDHTGTEPTGTEPTGTEPTGTEPTGTEPTGTAPAPVPPPVAPDLSG
jgi:MFS family permease